MKPGDLVRIRQDLAPKYDLSKYDGTVCLVVELLVSKQGSRWVRVLLDGALKSFRQEHFEVVSEAG